MGKKRLRHDVEREQAKAMEEEEELQAELEAVRDIMRENQQGAEEEEEEGTGGGGGKQQPVATYNKVRRWW